MNHRLSATSAILVAAACFSPAAAVVSAVPGAFTINFDGGSASTSDATVTVDFAEPMQYVGFNRIEFLVGSTVVLDRTGTSFGGAMQYVNVFAVDPAEFGTRVSSLPPATPLRLGGPE